MLKETFIYWSQSEKSILTLAAIGNVHHEGLAAGTSPVLAEFSSALDKAALATRGCLHPRTGSRCQIVEREREIEKAKKRQKRTNDSRIPH